MWKHVSAALCFALVASSAGATTFIENLSGPSLPGPANLCDGGGRLCTQGSIAFPSPVIMKVGDTLVVNVAYTNAPVPALTCVEAQRCDIGLNIPQGATDVTGNVHFNYPYQVDPGPDGFSFDASVVPVSPFANPNTTFTVTNVSWLFAPAPEPATWAILLFGIGALGFMMRVRQKRSIAFNAA